MKILDQSINLAREINQWRQAGFPILETSERQERYDQCRDCDEFSTIGRCRKCGCWMATKTWLATAQCPIGKWLATVEPGPKSPWLFDQPDQVVALRIELEQWLGTPFWSGTTGRAVAGVKADCVSFVERVFVNIGVLEPVQWPDYVTHNGGEEMRLLLLRTLHSTPNLQLVWIPMPDGPEYQPAEGDILAGSSGRAHHHLAIAGEGDTVWHCTEQSGVCIGTRSDPMLSKHLVAVFRFKA